MHGPGGAASSSTYPRASAARRSIKERRGILRLQQRATLFESTTKAEVVKKLSVELGDLGIGDRWWDASEDWELERVPDDVWNALEGDGFVRRHRRSDMQVYRLTEEGWAAGLEAAGIVGSDEFRERCRKLADYLESQLARQSSERGAVISLERLEADGFASGWVLNVLRSGLLKRVFPDGRMDARWDPGLHNVRVAPTFAAPSFAEDSR